MNDEDLLRYSRHVLLPELGIEGQQAIRDAHALIIGAGGLGSPASMYLASAGMGRLTIADGDEVDLTNLQRQLLHDDQRIGMPKAASALQTLRRINAGVEVIAVAHALSGDALDEAISAVDVVLDCSDNFQTRHAVNRACHAHRVPLVSGAAVRFDGQLSVFDFRQAACACYNCLFPESLESEPVRCAVMGVFAPVVGVVGAMQAGEALKLISGCGESLAGRLLLFDGLRARWREVALAADPGCTVCGAGTMA